ncbi:putative ATP/GTP-binding protein [Flavobacterium anhuiense]|uniref:Putative ATP/GTP-binding protein n=2 Tax=Flavobacterium anhuiense TaxID=459526 RepID=A0A444W1B9_9FLAO|nr:putative ATP/GTP-binding protein [Flavobacterium anhuiense]
MKQKTNSGIFNLNILEEKITSYNTILLDLDIDWLRKPNLSSNSILPFVTENTMVEILPLNMSKEEYFKTTFIGKLENHKKLLNGIQTTPTHIIRHYYINRKYNTPIGFRSSFNQLIADIILLNEEITNFYKFKLIGTKLNYLIPTLRTAHSLFEEKEFGNNDYCKIKKNIFLDTITKNYNLSSFKSIEPTIKEEQESSEKKIYTFTGLDLYNQIVNARNGLKEERKRFDEFEKFIGKEFFNSEPIDIVAQFNINEKHENNDKNEIINIHIKDKSNYLHDLGDGIQSLIVLMYTIFIAPENTMIFIDEPELNLHPGMQRLFLEQITNNQVLTKKKLTYVIATHSNHLLDLTIEKDNISVYSFSKKENGKFQIKNVNAGNNEIIRELGVNNSSVFLANSSIWVEGISDRNYIKAFLIAYCNSEKRSMPREDIDFAFLEYAGSNLVHYEFSYEDNDNIKAFALNNKIFILADNDSGKEEKHEKHKELCELNPENLKYKSTSPYREIENLISVEIWSKAMIELCNKNKIKKEEEKISVQESISKKISKINIEDYNDKYIGEYLKALKIPELNDVFETSGRTPKSLKSEYKAYLSKIILDKTINKEITWEDFSKNETVKSITEEIYEFILKK